jgi:hypothetical protein
MVDAGASLFHAGQKSVDADSNTFKRMRNARVFFSQTNSSIQQRIFNY